jgi:DNA-binding protein
MDNKKLENMVLDILCNFNNTNDSLSSVEDARAAISKAYSLTGLAKL